jgi:flagellar hook-length control protein FliK
VSGKRIRETAVTVGAIDQIRPAPASAQKGAVAKDQKAISFAETFKATPSTPEEDILPSAEPEAASAHPESAPQAEEEGVLGDQASPAQLPPEDGKIISQVASDFAWQAPAWFIQEPTAPSHVSGTNPAPPEPVQSGPDNGGLPAPKTAKAEARLDTLPVSPPDGDRGTAPSNPIAAPPTEVQQTLAYGGPQSPAAAGVEAQAAGRTAAQLAHTVPTGIAENLAQPLPKGQAAPDKNGTRLQTSANSGAEGQHPPAPAPPLPAAAAIATGQNGPTSGPAPGAALLLWGDVTPTRTAEPQDSAAVASFSPIGSAPVLGSTSTQPSPIGLPFHAIPAKLVEMRQSGKLGPVELSLSPEELGRIRMQITPDGDTVRIVLQAERAETAELLRRNSDALLSELRQSGFEGASFSFEGWGAGGQSDRSERQSFEPGETSTLAPVPQPFQRPTLPAGAALSAGLNLRL